jgi:hypothetical protein
MSDGFTVWEAEVAKRAGMPLEEVVAARKNAEFAGCWGWVKADGRRGYAWTEAGLSKLTGGVAKKTAADVVVKLLVHRGPEEGMKNTQFIEAVRPEDDCADWRLVPAGSVFSVRVRTNENFVRKTRGGQRMEVLVRVTGERRGELSGRHPRSKGVY